MPRIGDIERFKPGHCPVNNIDRVAAHREIEKRGGGGVGDAIPARRIAFEQRRNNRCRFRLTLVGKGLAGLGAAMRVERRQTRCIELGLGRGHIQIADHQQRLTSIARQIDVDIVRESRRFGAGNQSVAQSIKDSDQGW